MIIGFGISPSRVKVTGGAAAFDADAQAFFTAASITDSTQKSAVNQLVLDLKSYNIWTKCLAIYPICGGSASSHAVNLKTPGTYNLTFSTGWTHASTGATPNGSAYANTFFNPVTQSLTYNNNHLSYYSRTSAATSTSFYEIGSGNNTQGGTALSLYRNDTTGYYDSGTATANRLSISGLNGLGFFVGSSITTNVGKYFRNGSQLQSKNPLTNVSMQSYNFYLGAFNEQDTNTYYSNKQCAFASIGTGLTDTESSNFYTAVQAYQTTLSRNV